jgi:hypothetical protein
VPSHSASPFGSFVISKLTRIRKASPLRRVLLMRQRPSLRLSRGSSNGPPLTEHSSAPSASKITLDFNLSLFLAISLGFPSHLLHLYTATSTAFFRFTGSRTRNEALCQYTRSCCCETGSADTLDTNEDVKLMQESYKMCRRRQPQDPQMCRFTQDACKFCWPQDPRKN